VRGTPPFLTLPHKGGGEENAAGASPLNLSLPPLWGKARKGGSDKLAACYP
jgi:hypothetical protein